MAKKKSKKSKVTTAKPIRGDGEAKLFAFLATFLSIVGFVIALLAKRRDKYVMHYAKQSLVIFILYIIALAVMVVPIIGWIAGVVLYFFAIVLWVMSWIYALTGKVKYVPIIGKYSKKIDL